VAPRGRTSGGNGVYLYGSDGFPTATYNASNYWVDVVSWKAGAVATDVPGTRSSDSSLTVRSARVGDVTRMARVHVLCWQETYRGLMPDAVLDDPGFPAARERFWTAALTDARYRESRVAVAERNGRLIGVAMSGPPLDVAARWARQLYVLYVIAAEHGTGAGPVLLHAVVDPAESVALWVADPNPRAQAFYRKHGFVADGTVQVEDGVREIRMVRGA
jgi:GNAT superfamily N-acetyltransferase